jgi:hypothetical protein
MDAIAERIKRLRDFIAMAADVAETTVVARPPRIARAIAAACTANRRPRARSVRRGAAARRA